MSLQSLSAGVLSVEILSPKWVVVVNEVRYVNHLAMGHCHIELFEEIATKKYVPQMCTLSKKKTPTVQTYMSSPPRKKKDKSKMNSYRSMFFSPEAKSAKIVKSLGPDKTIPNEKITNCHGPKLGENPTKSAPLRLPSHPNARPKVSISTACDGWDMWCVQHMLRYFLRILQWYAVVTTRL